MFCILPCDCLNLIFGTLPRLAQIAARLTDKSNFKLFNYVYRFCEINVPWDIRKSTKRRIVNMCISGYARCAINKNDICRENILRLLGYCGEFVLIRHLVALYYNLIITDKSEKEKCKKIIRGHGEIAEGAALSGNFEYFKWTVDKCINSSKVPRYVILGNNQECIDYARKYYPWSKFQ